MSIVVHVALFISIVPAEKFTYKTPNPLGSTIMTPIMVLLARGING